MESGRECWSSVEMIRFAPFSQNKTVIKLDPNYMINNERKIEQAHIPHAPTLLENVVYNEWQFQALVMGNQTEDQFHLSCTK